ncbi:hypothetical protein NEOLEDRAFT_1143546 [Neolentinus lepideus HHB14362 ss-1]|uniref:Uncharacterized protein n=1 Tax=Neolentinus lepideus HHB14362 ss-1 TaxID=1314782 RepID=A0A165MGS6_9AGAM|nr:hypothetical protein NEOLEDRAFT_1143546 [Neolentinus lepideus HHB14362 ss-1]
MTAQREGSDFPDYRENLQKASKSALGDYGDESHSEAVTRLNGVDAGLTITSDFL